MGATSGVQPLKDRERHPAAGRAAPAGHTGYFLAHPERVKQSRNVLGHRPSEAGTASSAAFSASSATGPNIRLMLQSNAALGPRNLDSHRSRQRLSHGDRDRKKRDHSRNERGIRTVLPDFVRAEAARRTACRQIRGVRRRNSLRAGNTADGCINIAMKRFLI